MGSVLLMRLPTRLAHAGDLALLGQLPEADPAESKLAIHRARPPAQGAPAAVLVLVLGRPVRLVDL